MWEGDIMKTAIKTMMIGVAACTFAAPAFAYTISGTVPPASKWIAVNLQTPPKREYLKFTFSATPVNAGVRYDIQLCITRLAPNSCPLVMYISPGQQTIVTLDSKIFPTYTIWLGQGTSVPVPYTVEVDPVP
jgi:hypothetical protein